jgi:hypothetical protein
MDFDGLNLIVDPVNQSVLLVWQKQLVTFPALFVGIGLLLQSHFVR